MEDTSQEGLQPAGTEGTAAAGEREERKGRPLAGTVREAEPGRVEDASDWAAACSWAEPGRAEAASDWAAACS